MKRLVRILGMLALMTALFCISSLAAAPSAGIKNPVASTGYTQSLQTADGTAVSANGEGVYENAAKIQLTIGTTESGTYELIYIIKGTEADAPTESNLFYIDQTTGTGSAVTVTLYPKTLENGSYTVMRVNNDGVTEAAMTFEYYQPYKIGDANMDNAVNIQDAVAVLEYCVGSRTFEGSAKIAADANKDTSVNIQDAVAILEYCVGSRVL